MSSAESLPPNRPARRGGRWWPWHQRLGLWFAAVFLVVIVTGIALNHTTGLRLDQRIIRAEWLYSWYGMNPDGEPLAYDTGEGWAVAWGDRLYWNNRPVSGPTDIRGAVRLADVVAITTTNGLILLTPSGDIIEQLTSASLPTGEIQRVGVAGSRTRLVIETGNGIYQANAETTDWENVSAATEVNWSVSDALPPHRRRELAQAHRGEGLTLYRVLLDLHSGRFFGSVGVWIVDASAIALAFLTLTGTYYALRIKRR